MLLIAKLGRLTMMFPILICDDSGMARKMLKRSLPEDWPVTIHTVENGQQAMELMAREHIALLFLDLNMPEMDGYQVLQAMRQQQLETFVIVVSGDIQPQARQRVNELCAISFMQKPVNKFELEKVLIQYGIYQPGMATV